MGMIEWGNEIALDGKNQKGFRRNVNNSMKRMA